MTKEFERDSRLLVEAISAAGLAFLARAVRSKGGGNGLGGGVVAAAQVPGCFVGHGLACLNWIGMIVHGKAEECGEDEGTSEECPFDNYRLTADEPGEVRA